ncbi:chromate efflux transporter [Knoellia sp. 3-2P3]|uniref:chromate efflux transporter n=1 Tax=unclassified Knoellia TaxID=2618719 RepID=UPI0023DB99EF|nr:chromate efflux transporter [Knoellia sp. 3-2P3]MDF2093699.1 chromate efflux transporter [Knoellia sp. 3-2P3]
MQNWKPGHRSPNGSDVVPLREATRAWFLVSLQTFGGPAGQIAVMQRMLVEERRWIGQQRFLFALSFCTLLPGPEAQQLATYVGWLLNGIRGALIAGVLFVLPGVVVLLALSAIYVGYGDTTAVEAVFLGLGPAVIAIVVQALVRVGGRVLTARWKVVVAACSLIALAFFAVPFPVVIAAAALIGWLIGRATKTTPQAPTAERTTGPQPLISDAALHHERPSQRHSLLVLVTGLVLWLAPVAAAAAAFGTNSVFVEQGKFFSGAAVVTFGGAYAVLAYVAQQAVNTYHWLTGSQMVHGLALAETTPGPLIMVVQFVAFLGAYHDPGSLNPWVAAVIASLLTTWVTFVPSILFVVLGAPYVERLRANHSLSAALSGITAAVVGVIANLALYFALHTLFSDTQQHTWGPVKTSLPVPGTVAWSAVAITILGFLTTFRLKWSVLRTLGICALAGVAWQVAGALT